MSIVSTEIESVHGSSETQRMIFYRCQDSDGNWHSYGPVITIDPTFDVDAYKTIVANKVELSLEVSEFNSVLEG